MSSTDAAPLSPAQTVAVIRFSALGDVALTIPVLLAFCEQYPKHKIIFCTRPRFAPLFNTLPGVEILKAQLESRHKGLRGLMRLNSDLYRRNPNIILDLHSVLRTYILRFFNHFQTIPFISLDKGKTDKKRVTRLRNKHWSPLPHTTERYAAVFGKAGLPLRVEKGHVLQPRDIRDASLQEQLGDYYRIGIAPFAAHPAKMYELEQLEEIVAWLNKRRDCKVLIFGGGQEEQAHIVPWELRYTHCINMIQKVDFEEELALISRLDMMISMDSGNGHLSAIFGVPTLTIWGVTHPITGFAPFGQPEENSLLADRDQYPAIPTSVYGNMHPKGYEKAINTIPPEQIKRRIQEIMGW